MYERMYVGMYVCMYVCMYTYECMYFVCIFELMVCRPDLVHRRSVHSCLLVRCMYVYMYVRMYVGIFVRKYLCMYVCMYFGNHVHMSVGLT